MSRKPPATRARSSRPGARSTTRWADNDAYGHVNNTVYYEWFDSAVNAWMVEQGLLDIAQRRSDRSGRRDTLHLRCAARLSCSRSMSDSPSRNSAGRASAIASGSSPKDADSAAAEGEFVHVVVDRCSQRPVEIPASWRAKLEAIS